MEDEPFAVVWEGPTLEAQVLATALERALVPFDLDAATLPGRTRITVPSSYVREATETLNSAEGNLVPDTPAELFARRDRHIGIGPFASRAVVVLVAVVLVVAIILTYR